MGRQHSVRHRGARLFRHPDDSRQVLFGKRRSQRPARGMGLLSSHRRHHLRHAFPRRGVRQDRGPADADDRLLHVCRWTRARCSVGHNGPRSGIGFADVPGHGAGSRHLRGRLRSLPTGGLRRGQAIHQPEDRGDGLRGRLRPDESWRVLLGIRFANRPPPF
jgi:hypothetical protein